MRSFLQYVCAVLLVAAATLLNLAVYARVGSEITALYAIAVLLSAWGGGLGPGLLATILSTAAGAWAFAEPRFAMKFQLGLGDELRLSLFLMTAIVINLLYVRRRQAEERMLLGQGLLERRVEQRTGQLTTANAALRREIDTRQRAEQDLLDYQEQLRELSAELTLTEQRERRQLARQLHDGIGQLLSLAQMKLEMASASPDGCPHGQEIRETCALLDQIIDQTRSLTWELSPPILHVMGLRPALEWLVEQTQKRYGIALGLDCGPARVDVPDEELRTLLFHAVRELLMNVVKHADASSAMVEVRQQSQDAGADELQVSVVDDGVGLDPAATADAQRPPAGKHSFGMFSIRERLRHFGGRLEAGPARGRGTRVTIVVPIAPTATATTGTTTATTAPAPSARGTATIAAAPGGRSS